LVGEDTGQAVVLVAVQPGVDRIGVAGAEQAVTGDRVRGKALGDFQQGGATLTDVVPGVMVAGV
jgi:hypothetical protein